MERLKADIPTPFEEKQGGSFSAEGAKTSANGASFQGGLGACPPPPQEILQIQFLSSGISSILTSFLWFSLRSQILKRWINNSKEKLKNICDKNKQGDFFYHFRNGHLEKNMKNCKLTTRHKFIQWGATLVWALLYSLHAALYFDNRFLEGLNL